jgi:endonuclease YncB( thermonuclease family)
MFRIIPKLGRAHRRGPAGGLLFVVSFALLAAWVGPQLSRDLSAAAPSPPPMSGAARPVDGDTLALGSTRIRLWGVDAPEADTPLGREASRLMAQVLAQGPVRCEDTGGRSYDRIVARCQDASGQDLAHRLVAAGLAVDWPKFSAGRYAAAQAQAQQAGLGLHAASPHQELAN